MSSLKRKGAAHNGVPSKNSKTTGSDDRPFKRAKAEKPTDYKKGNKNYKNDKGDKNDKKNKASAPERPEGKPASIENSLVSRLKEEEPLFPRGGGGILTPLEYKQIQVQAKNDALFDQQAGKGAPDGPEAQAKKKAKADRRKSVSEGTKPHKKSEDSVKIESLSFKRLVKGSLVLGQIAEIGPFEITVSLPNNLIGHLPITSISAALTAQVEAEAEADNDSGDEDGAASDAEDRQAVDLHRLFHVGQYIRTAVLSTEDESPDAKNKRRIELSIQPELANASLTDQDLVKNTVVMAAVSSVEDRGFVMDLGIADSDVRGFLLKSELGPSLSEENLQPGAVLMCIVTHKDANGKVVQLSAQRKQLASSRSAILDAVTINAFVPGTIVEVLLSEVSPRSFAGKIMGHLDAIADTIHSGAGADGTDLEERYKVSSKVKARVICTFPTADAPKIGVSVLPHIMSLQSQVMHQGKDEGNGESKKEGQKTALSPLEQLPLSSIVEKCTVRRAELNVGLWVDIGIEGATGFVHISRVRDGKVDALYETSGPFRVGSVHRGRVLSYSAMDGVFQLSFEQHILEQPYLRIADIPVGEVVNGTIKRLVVTEEGVSGLIVEIADGISGLVPEMHLSDVKLMHPEKKFREGMKVKARVLWTDPSRHQFRLTLKKTLVNSDAPPLTSLNGLVEGVQCLGTIVKILPIGAQVQFYGRLRAFLPVGEMSEAFIKDPSEHFRVGQVLNVRVLKVTEARNRLIVTCKDPAAFGVEKQRALQDLQLCSSVSAKVVQKTEDSIEVELAESGLKATLPVGHLTDRSLAKSQALLKRIHVGQALSELIVLDKHEGRRLITLSQKPSLVAASEEGKLLASLEDVPVGAYYTGFVRNITPTAVFVQFAANIVALLPKPLMPAEIQGLPDFGMQKFQSLTVKILSSENGRLVASLRQEKGAPKPEVAEASDAATQAAGTLRHPIDTSLSTIHDMQIGLLTKAQITAVKATQLNVKLADNLQGRIDITEVFDNWADIADAKQPLKSFKVNQILRVRVLGVHDAKKKVYLPVTQKSSRSVLELSMKPSSLQDGPVPEALTMDKINIGSSWVGFVNNHESNFLWVSLSPTVRGRIYGLEASDDPSLANNLRGNFPVGAALNVRVLRSDAKQGRLDLSARSDDAEDRLTWANIEKDTVLTAKVTKVSNGQIIVQLNKTISGPLHLIDIADNYEQATTTTFFKHDIIRVSVVTVDRNNKRIRLSTRPSRILNSSLEVEDREIKAVPDVKKGDIVRGFVRSVSDKGLFVNLGGDVVGFVRIADLSDRFLKDWKAPFQIDQLVKGRVTAVDPVLGQIGLSLKESVVDDSYVPPRSLEDFEQGQTVTGRVRKVDVFGAFIVLDDSNNVSGLCHRTEMAEDEVKDARKLYREGDVVKAKILSIDRKTGRVNLGLKPSYFEDDSEDDEDAMSVDGGMAGASLAIDEASEEDDDEDNEDDEEDEDMEDAPDGIQISGTDNDIRIVEDVEDNAESSDDDDVAHGGGGGASVGLSGGFDWTGGALGGDDEEDDENDVDSGDEAARKAKSKSKKSKKSKMEVDRTAELDISGPQTASDFERLLLGQPDSSALWIAYMAFQLQVSELVKAREIAERAIRTINVRDETERLNVWIAYLNLEVAYGTDDTAEEVFKRACQYNDDREVYERAASVYIQSKKNEKADELFQAMVKKFGADSPQIWVNYGHFLHHSMHNADRARALMSRALQALDRHMSVNVVARLAALEFRSPVGSPELGRTTFEGLLDKWPKKVDLWDQLLDLESAVLAAEKAKGGKESSKESIKEGVAAVRDVFERGTKIKGLKARRAKAWFQRWAKWEEQNGDAKSRARVSARAKEWALEAEQKKAQAEAEESD